MMYCIDSRVLIPAIGRDDIPADTFDGHLNNCVQVTQIGDLTTEDCERITARLRGLIAYLDNDRSLEVAKRKLQALEKRTGERHARSCLYARHLDMP